MGGVKNPEAAINAAVGSTSGDGGRALTTRATERVTRKIDATNPDDLSYAEVECRKRVMEEVDRLRREVPGFKNAHLCHIADQIGITESRRLVGEYMLGRDDVDKPCDDVITITGHWTKYKALYYIPYRSLLPKEFSTLVADVTSWIIGCITRPKKFLRAWRQVKLLGPQRRWRCTEWSRSWSM
jgi:hypothetical protein